ncbi:MAG TPA: CPBP family intramembrane glutamic endopeptidase [Bryobacteraceae bacterium]|nr:CPBP family intramembrane glutamic endopeptidase [Bryobacteraceae bacterium]
MPIEYGSRAPAGRWQASPDERAGLRRFRTAVLAGWVVLAVAGVWYARVKDIPASAAAPVLAAFLLQYPFYLAPGFEAVRAWLEEQFSPLTLAILLTGSALLPYLTFSLGTEQFAWGALVQLAALALVITLWYVVLPASPPVDLGLLLLIAAVVLRRYFASIYPPPVPGLKGVDVLGHVALTYLAVTVLLTLRRVSGTGFGFVPSRADWRIGARHFLYFLPVGLPLGLALHQVGLGSPRLLWWRLAGTFFGVLWVVGLYEEFFFRGLLQQWLGRWTGSRQLARLATALLFGLVHLPFGAFPNWRFALLAAVAGWFYGRAYDQAGSIRASMVTHALVVTLRAALR